MTIRQHLEYECDMCLQIYKENTSVYKMKFEDLPKKTIVEHATTSLEYYGDSIRLFKNDNYKAYHICNDCKKEIITFVENRQNQEP